MRERGREESEVKGGEWGWRRGERRQEGGEEKREGEGTGRERKGGGRGRVGGREGGEGESVQSVFQKVRPTSVSYLGPSSFLFDCTSTGVTGAALKCFFDASASVQLLLLSSRVSFFTSHVIFGASGEQGMASTAAVAFIFHCSTLFEHGIIHKSNINSKLTLAI